MEEVEFGGKTYVLDEFGFLADVQAWDENFAAGMADRLGLVEGLTDGHWLVIRYLRKQIAERNVVPYFVIACKESGLRLGQFRDLFPWGYFRGACRIAGVSHELMLETNLEGTYESTFPPLKDYDVTANGYLKRFDAWDEQFPLLVAREWRLAGGLTDRHWSILRFLRSQYAARGKVPVVYETCHENRLSLQELESLFPGGYRRGACRMAGLPEPP